MRVVLLVLCAQAGLLRSERAGAAARVHAGVNVRLHTKASSGGLLPQNVLFASLEVGSPPREFLVALDTSSGHLILPSKACLSPACHTHRYYDGTLSTSGHALATLDDLADTHGPQETVTLAFGRGHVSGTFATDTVCMGALCVQLNFIEATTMSDEPFSLVPYDGVLGLGMPQLSTTKQFNFLGQLVGDHKLQHTQFAIWLARHGHGEADDDDSELTLGSFNTERLGSEVVWSPITSQPGHPMSGFWQLAVQDLTINGQQMMVCSRPGCQAIVDTSTTAIGLPSDLFDLFNNEATVKGDCSNLGQLPLLGFVINGYALNLRPADYVLRSADGAGCTSLLYPLNVVAPRGPLILLGTPFLTSFYSIYDRATLKIGFSLATHKHVTAELVPQLFQKLP